MEFISQLRRGDTGQGLSRRRLIGAALPVAAGALAVASGSVASAAPSLSRHVRQGDRVESRLFHYEDARMHQRQSFRVLRNSRDDADVLFWYHFTMFAVPENAAPQPVLRWEGIEFSHHRRLADGVYRVHGHNLSFPRDLASGQWTDKAVNPVSGATVQVPPMALTDDPGYLYTPAGVVPFDQPEAPPRLRVEQFLVEDDLVKLEQVRSPPASWPVTFVETSVNWVDRELFEDPRLPELPTGTAGGYVFPWPAWMQMGAAGGHMFATWHGRKLGGIRQLPAEFIARVPPEYLSLLQVDLAPFATPVPASMMRHVAPGP